MLKRENLNYNSLGSKVLTQVAYSLLSILIRYRKACLIKDSWRYKNFGTELNRIKIVTPKVLQTETNKIKYLGKLKSSVVHTLQTSSDSSVVKNFDFTTTYLI